MDKTYLQHHGIKGMKWGRRRYQNKDGSLTPEGQKRYSDDAVEAARIKKKSVSEMSNAELRKLNERQQLERTYAQNNKSKMSKGFAKATAILGTTAAVTGSALAIYTNAGKIAKIAKPVVNKVLENRGKDAVKHYSWIKPN